MIASSRLDRTQTCITFETLTSFICGSDHLHCVNSARCVVEIFLYENVKYANGTFSRITYGTNFLRVYLIVAIFELIQTIFYILFQDTYHTCKKNR